MQFEPIAIVGSSCVLPGALSREALWSNLVSGRRAIGGVPVGRWGVPTSSILGTPSEWKDRTWSDAGGYVEGFAEVFDPSGFGLPVEDVQRLDPVFQWVLHSAREALRPSGHEGASPRAGLILGNLSFPSSGMVQYVHGAWLEQQGSDFLGGRARTLAGVSQTHPYNRFMSGLPASLAARALGLGAGSFALDAACASSLYAIKLACDWLHDQKADLMLAGAVNAADSLFLHVGFCALAAMSRSGQSRPFHRGADGLVPAEGAAFVALKRLSDATAAGDRILGVIRGIGLSNDGRGRGLLMPHEAGQIRAMQQAYVLSELLPGDISVIECHATATPVGDQTELRSMSHIFAGQNKVPIGSIKANLGHPVTVAGLAGLLKVVSAMEHGQLPPMPPVEEPLDELAASPFRLLSAPEAWPADRPRRAAVNAFGFGGNNAHLIVEHFDEWSQENPTRVRAVAAPLEAVPVAIVALSARVGNDRDTGDFTAQLFASAPDGGRCETVHVALDGLRFPPNDIRQSLPQQLLVLEAAREAVSGIALASERTGVFIGMGVDPEVARYGARWQMLTWAERWVAELGGRLDEGWKAAARDAAEAPLSAAGVLGTMPNIVANRINSQLDLAGQSFSVSSEELSGVTALELGLRALASGELDAAVVGAVDLSDEVAHRKALAELGVVRPAADGVAVLVLKRLTDAERDGDEILAVLENAPAGSSFGTAPGSVDLLRARGSAHAASGLLQVAAAAIALRYGVRPGPERSPLPWLGARAARVTTRALLGGEATVSLRAAGSAQPFGREPGLRLEMYSGKDRRDVLEALRAGRTGSAGPARLVIAAQSEPELARLQRSALRSLVRGERLPEGVAFREAPQSGELAFVFTGAAAAYPGMGSQLMLALPQLAEPLAGAFSADPTATDWLSAGSAPLDNPLGQLWASSYLCQVHARLSRTLLGLRPQAVIGYSSGESNALFAFEAWRDLEAMIRDCNASATFNREIAGDFLAVQRAWNKRGYPGRGSWQSFAVAAAPEVVREALRGEDFVHLTIINSPQDCVIGGEPSACERVLRKIGPERAVPLEYRLAAHCPELEEVREPWFALHQRPTWDVPGVRFYWNATGEAQAPSTDWAATAITRQALQVLDFPRVIERAYADGVRIFVEHGPRDLCSGWIGRILGKREHLAISLDVRGRSSIRQALNAAAGLLAAGVSVEHRALLQALSSQPQPLAPEVPRASIPAHREALKLPRIEQDVQFMQEAPFLPAEFEEPMAESSTRPRAALPGLQDRAAPAPSPAPVAEEIPAAMPAVAARVALPSASWTGGPPAAAQALDEGRRLPAPAAGLTPMLANASEQQARWGAVHRDFLEQQGAVQQRFLQLQQTLLARLLVGSRELVARGRAPWPRPLELPSAGKLTPAGGSSAARPAAAPQAAGSSALGSPPSSSVVPSPARRKPPAHVPEAPNGGAALKGRAPEARVPEGEMPEGRLPGAKSPDVSSPEARSPVPRTTEGGTVAPARSTRPGPKLSRADLIHVASGRISERLGREFEFQDDYFRQVRMPEPPLLLADRVTGIDAVPASMGTGTLWTETDVREDSWYLHHGRMPAGIMIEAGQADLLLISYLGIDRFNQSERVYRLLGCEATFHGDLPRPGDVLDYDIHVDGHARQGAVRLFFFHYDCRVNGRLALSVRHGQAGFFSDAELADSAGVLWDPASAKPESTAPLAAPVVECQKREFSADDVRAFSEGRVWDCFGPGFEPAQAHVRTPHVAAGQMLLIDHIPELAPAGGPWKRGYVRAERRISPDDWFFAGHFKNDPCMPGTLMFEGCLQVMAFFLTALGFTLERDGWRFQPVSGQKSSMRCRGQVTPSSKLLTIEVFVHDVKPGEQVELYADLLCTVDGLKAFHAQRVGLRLVPDWPLEAWKHGPVVPPARGAGAPLELARLGGLSGYVEPKPVASQGGFAFDYASLLACAWGKPSTAFGPFYQRFDSPRRVARLPGPPYHFISRVRKLEAEMGVLRAGGKVEVEYDIPEECWYFDDNGSRTMPLCVLMEAALQPCGWLASYLGSTVATDIDLMFRNLDGTATLSSEIRPGAGTLRTEVRAVNISKSQGMIIESFEVRCFLGEACIYSMNTVFGFFPKEAFENQAGLSTTSEERARIAQPSDYLLDLTTRPERYFDAAPRLASGKLFMLDRISAFDPKGGAKGLGWVRAEKDVDASEWFFKAHFFQDPVQPGSLGIEALCQLLQFTMLELGLAEGIDQPRFEPLALERPLTWKYRGQVVPKNERITSELEVTEIGDDERGRFATADAYLWVDGKRIYHAKGLGMRIVGRFPAADSMPPSAEQAAFEEVLDPDVDRWLRDHCPTWTVPALPMMSMLDRMAAAAQRVSGQRILGLHDVNIRRWLVFEGGPVRLRTEVRTSSDGLEVTLSAWRDANNPLLSRFEPVVSGRVQVGTELPIAPEPWPEIAAELSPDPYAQGTLFHGPAFQLLRSLRIGPDGASAELDAGAGSVPEGCLRPGLLDAATHAIPHDALHRWCGDIALDRVAYPYRILHLRSYGPLPSSGPVRVEARFAGLSGEPRLPTIDLQLIAEGRVRVELRLAEILVPKGPLGLAAPAQRRTFLQDRAFVSGLGLSEHDGSVTRLSASTLQATDWLPGNVARIYGLPARASGAGSLLEQVAIKDHVGWRASTHPALVTPALDGSSAVAARHPLLRHPVTLRRQGDAVSVTDAGPPRLDLSPLSQFWRRYFGMGPWIVEDLYYAMAEQFIGDVVVTDPSGFERVRGRSVLYLANHQVGIESLLFGMVIGALSNVTCLTLAKAEHRTSWLGRLIQQSFSYPGVRDPGMIAFFRREEQSELLAIVGQLVHEMLHGAKSVMVHVEGTRALSCRHAVIKMSSAIVEMALSAECPVVPVRFTRGLPREELSQRLEFPVGHGRQEIFLGRPIFPDELRALPLKERKEVIIEGINGIGPKNSEEIPSLPNGALQERVGHWLQRPNLSAENAVLLAALELYRPEAALTRVLLERARTGQPGRAVTPEEQWLANFEQQLFGPVEA
jgi:acyl transferase domain-containing protein/3-hydroxymyristoyl/3-hydroxydecanoyl-(acyl carrier protein) dehydratase/1-acyl-sn-glycerol-3-phosphate acyltransferase